MDIIMVMLFKGMLLLLQASVHTIDAGGKKAMTAIAVCADWT